MDYFFVLVSNMAGMMAVVTLPELHQWVTFLESSCLRDALQMCKDVSYDLPNGKTKQCV